MTEGGTRRCLLPPATHPTWNLSEWLSRPSRGGLRASENPDSFCGTRNTWRGELGVLGRQRKQQRGVCSSAADAHRARRGRLLVPKSLRAARRARNRNSHSGGTAAHQGSQGSVQQAQSVALAVAVRRHARTCSSDLPPPLPLTFSPECSISTVIIWVRSAAEWRSTQQIAGQGGWPRAAQEWVEKRCEGGTVPYCG